LVINKFTDVIGSVYEAVNRNGFENAGSSPVISANNTRW